MSNKTKLATVLGAAFLATSIAPLASAEVNPFSATQLNSGYDLANYAHHEEGEGKDAEGKCGEGKCGEGMKSAEEGKCGEGKKAAKEGKCGEAKGGAAEKADKEGKCGEGKCGGEK